MSFPLFDITPYRKAKPHPPATLATPATLSGREPVGVAKLASVATLGAPNVQPGREAQVSRQLDAPPPPADPCDLADAIEERSAIHEHCADFPRAWADAFAALAHGPVPPGFELRQWQQTIDGALRFADTWATRAHAIGWQFSDLFGLHPTHAAQRQDAKGLAFALAEGAEVVGLTAELARISTRSGALQTYHRKKRSTDCIRPEGPAL